MLFHARLGQIKLPAGYDKRFTRDRFGLFIACSQEQTQNAKKLLSSFNPEEINAVQ
jgi:hypothetical protein